MAHDLVLSKKTNAQNIIDAQIAINFPALLGLAKLTLPMDLFISGGVGGVSINRNWDWVFLIGGGLKIHLIPKWMALRIDINSYLHNTQTIEGKKFGADFTGLAGLAFFFPYAQ